MNKIKSAYIILENGDKIPFELSEETKKEIMKKMSTPEKWKPKDLEQYFYIDSCGIISRGVWNNLFRDIWLYRNNMVFKTAAYAEKYKKVFEAICEVEEAYPVDWKNKDQDKYSLLYNYYYKKSQVNEGFICKRQGTKYASCKDFEEKVFEKGILEQDLDWFLMR